MRSGTKRLDWLVSWLPSELMNDLSKTRLVVGLGQTITADHRLDRLDSAESSTFFQIAGPVHGRCSRSLKRVGGNFASSLYYLLYFASRCPPVSQLTTLMTILSLSPRITTNLSSIFRHLLIIIPIPTILLVPGMGQLAPRIQRHPSTHNVPTYELIPTWWCVNACQIAFSNTRLSTRPSRPFPL